MRLGYANPAMRTAAHHRSPVVSIADLFAMDDAEMSAGYRAGIAGEPCPDDRSRAFWHGWRCGRVDGGFDPMQDDIVDLGRKAGVVRGALGAGWDGRMH